MADSDPVNHPEHYTFSAIEVIDAIEAWELGFHLGNAIKYIARAGRKGDALQDLLKARWYLDRAIERNRKVVEQTQGDKQVGEHAKSVIQQAVESLDESVWGLSSLGACPEEEDKPEHYLHVFKDGELQQTEQPSDPPHEHDWEPDFTVGRHARRCTCGAVIALPAESSIYSREDGSKHSTWHQASRHKP